MGHGRPKGLPKTGGRKKGTPNKKTSIRDAMEMIYGGGDPGAAILKRLMEGIDTQAPYQQVDALLELLQYFFSKEKAVEEHKVDGGFRVEIVDYTKND